MITFDHRGIGRSESLMPAYTTEAMADDAVSILDELGLESAHVYGISLGGMIAQQLALRHPERIRSLVLGATQPGGRRAVHADAEVMAFFRQRSRMDKEEAAWASVEFNYGPRCRAEHADRIAEDIERRLEQPFNAQAYRAQLFAAAMHNCYGRLDRIARPDVRGARGPRPRHPGRERAPDGRAAPELPADRCSRTSGHLYPTEAPEVDEAIGDFFDACDAARG